MDPSILVKPLNKTFFIAKSSSGGYTVYERVVKGENNTNYIKTICYPATFSYALKKAAEELLNNNKNYNSIENYIKEYKGIEERLLTVMS